MNDKIEKLQEGNPEQQETSLAAVVAANEQVLAIDRQFAREGEVFELSTVETKVVQLQQIAGQSILEMGRLLAWMKERVRHGEFGKSLDRMGLNARSSQQYIQLYEKYKNISNTKPVSHLGLVKALELAKSFDDDELEDLFEGGEVKGFKLDELAVMSKRQFVDALREQGKKHDKELEGKDKHADQQAKELRKAQNDKYVFESGSDEGREYCGTAIAEMRELSEKINSCAVLLKTRADEWAAKVASGDERALHSHPFFCSDLAFMQKVLSGSMELCAEALQIAELASHPDLQFPAGTEYPAQGWSQSNLPKDMSFELLEGAEDDDDESPDLPLGYEVLKPKF